MNLVTHALGCGATGGAVTEDGTGRGVPLAVTPLLEVSKRAGFRASSRDGSGVGAEGGPMFTLQAGAQHGVAIASFDLAQITSNVNRTRVSPELPASTLNAKGQMHVASTLVSPGRQWNSAQNLPNLVSCMTDLRGRGVDIRVNGDIADTMHAAKGQSEQQIVATTATVRRLTPLECERLQGLPDSWTEGESDSARYRMLGNSVATPVVEWIARRMRIEDGAVACGCGHGGGA